MKARKDKKISRAVQRSRCDRHTSNHVIQRQLNKEPQCRPHNHASQAKTATKLVSSPCHILKRSTSSDMHRVHSLRVRIICSKRDRTRSAAHTHGTANMQPATYKANASSERLGNISSMTCCKRNAALMKGTANMHPITYKAQESSETTLRTAGTTLACHCCRRPLRSQMSPPDSQQS